MIAPLRCFPFDATSNHERSKPRFYLTNPEHFINGINSRRGGGEGGGAECDRRRSVEAALTHLDTLLQIYTIKLNFFFSAPPAHPSLVIAKLIGSFVPRLCKVSFDNHFASESKVIYIPDLRFRPIIPTIYRHLSLSADSSFESCLATSSPSSEGYFPVATSRRRALSHLSRTFRPQTMYKFAGPAALSCRKSRLLLLARKRHC